MGSGDRNDVFAESAPPPRSATRDGRSTGQASCVAGQAAADPDRIGKYEIARRFTSSGRAAAFLGFDPVFRRHVVQKRYAEFQGGSQQWRPLPHEEPLSND
ncbi:MAG: hypothetical protein ACLQIB_42435 [Isosphaeraceae bacterium]